MGRYLIEDFSKRGFLLVKWTHKLISTYLEEQRIRANSLNFYLETESEKEVCTKGLVKTITKQKGFNFLHIYFTFSHLVD